MCGCKNECENCQECKCKKANESRLKEIEARMSLIDPNSLEYNVLLGESVRLWREIDKQ